MSTKTPGPKTNDVSAETNQGPLALKTPLETRLSVPGGAVRTLLTTPAHLRGGDYHRPVDVRRGQVLDNREVFVRCPGRGVHNEEVNLSPVHVSEELLDHA